MFRGGINTSSNAATNGDNYTRLTNYIAATLAAGMGQYVGMVINQDLFQQIRSTQLSFLNNMLGQGLLGKRMAPCPSASFAIPQIIRNHELVSVSSNLTHRSNIRPSTSDLLMPRGPDGPGIAPNLASRSS